MPAPEACFRVVRPDLHHVVGLFILRDVRLSGEVSGHLPENTYREWPALLHADVS